MGTTVNQHRFPKGATANVDWKEHVPHPLDNGPHHARVGMSLTRLGSGESARIVLFGGFEGEEFADSTLQCYWPSEMRWCTMAERGAVRGRLPAPRAGHSASAIGRHQMLMLGGRCAGGLSKEAWMLQMSRARQGAEHKPVFTWSRPAAVSGASPCARAHHAVAIFEGESLHFGGEAIMNVSDREEMLSAIEQAARKVRKMTAMSISVGISEAAMDTPTLPALAGRERVSVARSEGGSPRPHILRVSPNFRCRPWACPGRTRRDFEPCAATGLPASHAAASAGAASCQKGPPAHLDACAS